MYNWYFDSGFRQPKPLLLNLVNLYVKIVLARMYFIGYLKFKIYGIG